MTGRWLVEPGVPNMPAHECEPPDLDDRDMRVMEARRGAVWLCDCGRGWRWGSGEFYGWDALSPRRLRRVLRRVEREHVVKGAVFGRGAVPSQPPPSKPSKRPPPPPPDTGRGMRA